MNKRYKGFIEPVITEDNHVLGSIGIPLPIIKVDGDWTKYLPDGETQLQQTFDSDGCTVYGTTNAVETLENFLYGVKSNYSDRFLYNAVEITPPGSDPHLVATTWRGVGAVDESYYPDNTATLEEFMVPRPLTIDLRIKGQSWLNKRQLGHQWLWTGKPDQNTRLSLIKEALNKGTVCVSVTAWYKNDKGLYYSPIGMPNEHWTHVYNVDETGIYVFDSYKDESGSFLKKLTLDHNIEFAKVYFETVPTKQQNWLVGIITSLLQLVGLIEKEKEIVVQNPIATPPSPVIVKPMETTSLLTKFCIAIRDYEGQPGDLNYRNNNPGNCRFSSVGYSSIYGDVKKDSRGFAIFPTYELGFLYLTNLIKEKISANPEQSILQFFHIYAPSSDKNDPDTYASWVANQIGLSAQTHIKILLT
jgi:hypothetical protein